MAVAAGAQRAGDVKEIKTENEWRKKHKETLKEKQQKRETCIEEEGARGWGWAGGWQRCDNWMLKHVEWKHPPHSHIHIHTANTHPPLHSHRWMGRQMVFRQTDGRVDKHSLLSTKHALIQYAQRDRGRHVQPETQYGKAKQPWFIEPRIIVFKNLNWSGFLFLHQPPQADKSSFLPPTSGLCISLQHCTTEQKKSVYLNLT